MIIVVVMVIVVMVVVQLQVVAADEPRIQQSLISNNTTINHQYTYYSDSVDIRTVSIPMLMDATLGIASCSDESVRRLRDQYGSQDHVQSETEGKGTNDDRYHHPRQ